LIENFPSHQSPLHSYAEGLFFYSFSHIGHRRSNINVLSIIDDDSHLVGLIRLHDILSY